MTDKTNVPTYLSAQAGWQWGLIEATAAVVDGRAVAWANALQEFPIIGWEVHGEGAKTRPIVVWSNGMDRSIGTRDVGIKSELVWSRDGNGEPRVFGLIGVTAAPSEVMDRHERECADDARELLQNHLDEVKRKATDAATTGDA